MVGGGGGGGGGGGLQRRAGCGRPEGRPPQHCSFNPTKRRRNFQSTRKRLHFLVYNIILYYL